MWLEARQALLLAKLNDGADAMTAHRAGDGNGGGAACLGRTGELGTLTVGAVADIAVWDQTELLTPEQYLIRLRHGCDAGQPVFEHHHRGREVVKDGYLVSAATEEMLAAHAVASKRVQRLVQ